MPNFKLQFKMKFAGKWTDGTWSKVEIPFEADTVEEAIEKCSPDGGYMLKEYIDNLSRLYNSYAEYMEQKDKIQFAHISLTNDIVKPVPFDYHKENAKMKVCPPHSVGISFFEYMHKKNRRK